MESNAFFDVVNGASRMEFITTLADFGNKVHSKIINIAIFIFLKYHQKILRQPKHWLLFQNSKNCLNQRIFRSDSRRFLSSATFCFLCFIANFYTFHVTFPFFCSTLLYSFALFFTFSTSFLAFFTT